MRKKYQADEPKRKKEEKKNKREKITIYMRYTMFFPLLKKAHIHTYTYNMLSIII